MSLKPTDPATLAMLEEIDELQRDGRILRHFIRKALVRAQLLHNIDTPLADSQLVSMLNQLGDVGYHARVR